MSAAAMVAAARAAVGAPFRLHGRTVAHGLDCIGLVALALAAGGYRGPLPSGYALRSDDARMADRWAERIGLTRVGDAATLDGAGDVLLMRAGPGQMHLGIDAGGSLIHADAALRRVVERPGAPPWPVLRRWRYTN